MKKKVYFVLVGVLIIISVLCASDYSIAYGNRYPGAINERHQGTYSFIRHDSPSIGVHSSLKTGSYGTHDWIADSALRLLLMNPAYRRMAEQIFPSDPNQPKECFIDLNEVQSGPIKNIMDKYYYAYYSGEKEEFNRIQWLKMRRYVNFLFGTQIPDNVDGVPKYTQSRTIKVEGDFIPEEQVYMPIFNFPKHGLNAFPYRIKENSYRIMMDRSDVMKGAVLYHIGAIELSKIEYEVSYNNDDKVKIKGKYEGMAQCLGAMTHFIADMALPQHLNSHAVGWSFYAALFGENKGFSNGGPDWSEVNPSLNSGGIFPVPPALAVYRMIEETCACLDTKGPLSDDDVDYNPNMPSDCTIKKSRRPVAAIHFNILPTKDDKTSRDVNKRAQYDRMVQLISRSAYWTANALAFTMLECGLNKTGADTFGERGVYEASQVKISGSTELRAPTEKPADSELIKDILKGEKSRSDSSKITENLLSLTRIGLIGLIGIIFVEILKNVVDLATGESPVAIPGAS